MLLSTQQDNRILKDLIKLFLKNSKNLAKNYLLLIVYLSIRNIKIYLRSHILANLVPLPIFMRIYLIN